MKKVLTIATAFIMIFAYTLCGCGSEEVSAETYYEKTGTVQEIDGSSLTIFTKADEELTFDISNAEIDSEGELKQDDIATVYYSGEIVDGDTSGCTVYEVTGQAGEEQLLEGILVDIDSAGGTILLDSNGLPLIFDITGAERHYSNGLQKGSTLTIKYTGVISGADTSRAHVHVVIESADNKTKEKETVKVKAVNETVWTTKPVNVRTGSSAETELVATLDKGTKLTRTGILDDGWSRVEYKGKDEYIASQFLTTDDPGKEKKTTTTTTTTTTTSTTKATETATETQTETQTETVTETETETATETETEPTEPTEPPVEFHEIKGAVGAGTTTGTIVLMTADEKTLTFKLNDETEVTFLDGPLEGRQITIEYVGEINGTDTSQVTVLKVYDTVK